VVYVLGSHATHVARQVEAGSQAQADPEGKNAERGRDLARLARRSRGFSRGPEAWKAAWKIFLHCFHCRPWRKQRFPNYPAHAFQFINP